jgi:hypothetical protein
VRNTETTSAHTKLNCEDKRQLVNKFLSNDEVISALFNQCFSPKNRPGVFEAKSETDMVKIHSDPEFISKTTDYNQRLLDAVVAGTSHQRRTKTGSIAPTSSEPLD